MNKPSSITALFNSDHNVEGSASFPFDAVSHQGRLSMGAADPTIICHGKGTLLFVLSLLVISGKISAALYKNGVELETFVPEAVDGSIRAVAADGDANQGDKYTIVLAPAENTVAAFSGGVSRSFLNVIGNLE